MKTALSKEEIEKLARLSNLSLSEKEIKKIGSQFEETIKYVENLNDLDISNVRSLTNVTGQENKFFEDGEGNSRLLSRDQATLNSKNKKNGLFVVPKVFK